MNTFLIVHSWETSTSPYAHLSRYVQHDHPKGKTCCSSLSSWPGWFPFPSILPLQGTVRLGMQGAHSWMAAHSCAPTQGKHTVNNAMKHSLTLLQPINTMSRCTLRLSEERERRLPLLRVRESLFSFRSNQGTLPHVLTCLNFSSPRRKTCLSTVF